MACHATWAVPSVMMDLANLLTPERVALDLEATSKRQVLRQISETLAPELTVSPEVILKALLEREKLGTTGIGDGLAIPHAKLAELDTVLGFFARLRQPVDFDALDEEPVDLVFLLLAPSASGADHLKALAKVARVFRDKALCGRLREAKDTMRVYEHLVARSAPDAA